MNQFKMENMYVTQSRILSILSAEFWWIGGIMLVLMVCLGFTKVTLKISRHKDRKGLGKERDERAHPFRFLRQQKNFLQK